MHLFGTITLAALAARAAAQTTYTGCHMHGSVSYCFDSNGIESAMATLSGTGSASSTPASVSASTTAEAQTTAITSCHLHATNVFCIDGHGDEVSVSFSGTPTTPIPAQYTDCHAHGSEKYCLDPEGNDVAVLSTTEASHDHAEESNEETEGEMDCHFHAGVE